MGEITAREGLSLGLLGLRGNHQDGRLRMGEGRLKVLPRVVGLRLVAF